MAEFMNPNFPNSHGIVEFFFIASQGNLAPIMHEYLQC